MHHNINDNNISDNMDNISDYDTILEVDIITNDYNDVDFENNKLEEDSTDIEFE